MKCMNRNNDDHGDENLSIGNCNISTWFITICD